MNIEQFEYGEVLTSSKLNILVNAINSLVEGSTPDLDDLKTQISELETLVTELKTQVNELQGGKGSTTSETSEIDSMNEVKNLLSGIDNSKNLKQSLQNASVSDDGIVSYDL